MAGSGTGVVTREQLEYLATNCPTGSYDKLCHQLGYTYSAGQAILEKYRNDYKKALMEILHEWAQKHAGSPDGLRQAMINAEIGGMILDMGL